MQQRRRKEEKEEKEEEKRKKKSCLEKERTRKQRQQRQFMQSALRVLPSTKSSALTKSSLFNNNRSANATCSMASTSTSGGRTSRSLGKQCLASTTVIIASRRALALIDSFGSKIFEKYNNVVIEMSVKSTR